MRRLRILHVEDNREDAWLLAKACERANLPADFHEVMEGGQAAAYLKGEGDFGDRTRHPLPDVIVLDLRMPGMDGFEFLAWLRSDARFRAIPVLVLTQSVSANDRLRASECGVDGYFVKPVNFDALVRLAESFKQQTGWGLSPGS